MIKITITKFQTGEGTIVLLDPDRHEPWKTIFANQAECEKKLGNMVAVYTPGEFMLTVES